MKPFLRTSPRARAFTLIELIVVVVILGLLVAVASFAYNSVMDNSRDNATLSRVHQIARDALGAAAQNNSTDVSFAEDQFATAAGGTPVISSGDLTGHGGPSLLADATLTLTDYLADGVTRGPSLDPSRLSVAVDGNKAAIALRSPAGSCAVGVAHGTQIKAVLWHGEHGSNCLAQLALTNGTADPGPGTGGGEGGGGDGDGLADLAAPTNLSVTSAAGVTPVTLTWTAVTAADAAAVTYHVYLDGAETAVWDGTATTASFAVDAATPHTAYVTATTQTPQRSAPSDPVDIACLNNAYSCAYAMPAPDVYGTYAAEGQDIATRKAWWTFTPKADGTYTFDMLTPDSTPAISGFKQFDVFVDATTEAGLGTALASSQTATQLVIHGVKDTTYRIRVMTISTGTPGYVKLQVRRGPPNDEFADALVVPALNSQYQVWTSDNVSNEVAGKEPGEGSGGNSVWWRFVPTYQAKYELSVVAPTDPYAGPARSGYKWFEVFDSPAGATAANPGTSVVSGGGSPSVISFVGYPGHEYWIKVGVTSTGTPGAFRLQVVRGSDNGTFATATEVPQIGAVGVGSTWKNVTSNAYGENNYVWWKFTPTTSGVYQFTAAAAAAGTYYGGARGGYCELAIYTGATSPADLGTKVAGTSTSTYNCGSAQLALSATAGTTYTIRMRSVSNGTPGGFEFRAYRSA